MKRIEDLHFYDIKALNSGKSVNTVLPLHSPSPLADKVVGFNDEMKEMIDRLSGGSEELDILSIVGMPGAEGIGVSDNLSNKKEEDLAEKVYKSLKGQKYLIVLDDIWDVRAWDVLKLSFPDDNVGSRIMFTSRIHDLVSKVKSGCVPLTLRPLSEENSWELLEKNLFDQDDCPTDTFVDIGTQIATKCMGLPLAVVLIAGLLKKDIMNLDWWRQVGERLDKLVAIEDCKGILEESYKQLPDFLKPCFLYFGSFQEDENIQGKEENVFQVFDRNKDSNDLHYRICIQDNCWSSFLCHENGSAAPFVHSLLPFPKDRGHLHGQILEPKHIRCLATHFRFLQVLFLRSNVYVGAFPEAITELVLLKCLIIACNLKTVPPSIKKLENLETLIFEHHFLFHTESKFPLMAVLEMQKLRHLFTLKCQIKRPNSSLEEPKLILKLDYLSHLESLRVHYRTFADKRSSFELHFPYTLKKLHLLNFSLPWSSMPAAISRLPNLEVLKLDGGIFGKAWNVEDYEFQTLKFLRIKNLEIEEFNASDDSFPCLWHIVVDACEYLQEIPIRFASISTLKIIEVNRHLESSARAICRNILKRVNDENPNAAAYVDEIFVGNNLLTLNEKLQRVLHVEIWSAKFCQVTTFIILLSQNSNKRMMIKIIEAIASCLVADTFQVFLQEILFHQVKILDSASGTKQSLRDASDAGYVLEIYTGIESVCFISVKGFFQFAMVPKMDFVQAVPLTCVGLTPVLFFQTALVVILCCLCFLWLIKEGHKVLDKGDAEVLNMHTVGLLVIYLQRCVICRTEYKSGSRLATLPCAHQYHSVCITQWLKLNKVRYPASELAVPFE
ncbi:hypothetical protein M9H77_10617 [Catharanthus roseus]|uniref:Uncharacterized protein n=1 Tax=Catharanthus roseus TaxID=4058 RepID=A0ACC0BCG9_CATRO|nr:hypothetical protein M9H77_10617 [Catharanthus roseus]